MAFLRKLFSYGVLLVQCTIAIRRPEVNEIYLKSVELSLLAAVGTKARPR